MKRNNLIFGILLIFVVVIGVGVVSSAFSDGHDLIAEDGNGTASGNGTEGNGTEGNGTEGNGTEGNGTAPAGNNTPTATPQKTVPATNKVVKKATKITAKKKVTFKKSKKVKKFSITLKANKKAVKKVKVTLKVGKKVYKATTNSKGKATFKITKLNKKGKYTGTIKFGGSKNFKATSKKVKITVKK